jgi:nucleoside-triphosphatase THEP1
MNFEDALLSVELVLDSDAVPLLIGDSGIGKTSLIKKLCNRKSYYGITIDGNMLKEGEIGGLPTVDEYSVMLDGKEVKRKKTNYAVHTKLLEIDNVLKEQPDIKILLFIDEINRCEHTVQQELMNIILNREINSYVLPKNVMVVAAMNPSSKYEKYSESEYQVVDMDPAQENRFVWLEMEADTKSWIDWGMKIGDKSPSESNIHQDVLLFISSFPELLNTPYSKEMIKATPRSWERISDSYRVYLKRKSELPWNIFFNVLKGNVGPSIAQEFYTFIDNNKNPLINVEDIFDNGEISDDIKAKIHQESHSRLYITAKNILNYLENCDSRRDKIEVFAKFLYYYPADLKLGIMKDIKESFSEKLYGEFLDNDSFIEGYFSNYIEIEG